MKMLHGADVLLNAESPADRHCMVGTEVPGREPKRGIGERVTITLHRHCC